jgi:aminoglycoside phosphotransferase (APT) family kinase protein
MEVGGSRKPDIARGLIDAVVRDVFGSCVPVAHHRTPDGVSTQVYRLHRGSDTLYLRVAENADDNLETEAELHDRLGALGVRVARVVHVEPFNDAIGRSIMITTEVPGACLAAHSAAAFAAAVVEEAGADLAVLNQVTVDGFGWVRRCGRRWPMRAQHTTYAAFVTSYLPQPWPGPLASLFDPPTLDAIEDLIEQERTRIAVPSVLAHGDFDTTQIFCADGRYTGLIDFGEIRGAEPLFDLGHFHLYTRGSLLSALLTGYRRIGALPEDSEQSIRRSAILLGLRQLCRWLDPPLRRPVGHPAVACRARRIEDLLLQPR